MAMELPTGNGAFVGLKRDRTANVVIKGRAFIQNLRRGHYDLGRDTTPQGRLAAAFDDLLTTV